MRSFISKLLVQTVILFGLLAVALFGLYCQWRTALTQATLLCE